LGLFRACLFFQVSIFHFFPQFDRF
jgi:hypothetical protein